VRATDAAQALLPINDAPVPSKTVHGVCPPGIKSQQKKRHIYMSLQAVGLVTTPSGVAFEARTAWRPPNTLHQVAKYHTQWVHTTLALSWGPQFAILYTISTGGSVPLLRAPAYTRSLLSGHLRIIRTWTANYSG